MEYSGVSTLSEKVVYEGIVFTNVQKVPWNLEQGSLTMIASISLTKDIDLLIRAENVVKCMLYLPHLI